MKVGTDGVLLGAWTPVDPRPGHIADVGAGSGLIALMMAQRVPDASVTALEIDPAAAGEAERNVAASPWAGRITVECGDFLTWSPPCRYDLIVSNPPFFTESLHSPDPRRSLARHEGGLSPQSLIERAAGMLAPGGRLAMITPATGADEVEWLAALHRLSVCRRTEVSPRSGRAPIRILWELSVADGVAERSHLDLRDAAGAYTAEYVRLVDDFYLWMK